VYLINKQMGRSYKVFFDKLTNKSENNAIGQTSIKPAIEETTDKVKLKRITEKTIEEERCKAYEYVFN
jgi:hypothetical protein